MILQIDKILPSNFGTPCLAIEIAYYGINNVQMSFLLTCNLNVKYYNKKTFISENYSILVSFSSQFKNKIQQISATVEILVRASVKLISQGHLFPLLSFSNENSHMKPTYLVYFVAVSSTLRF